MNFHKAAPRAAQQANTRGSGAGAGTAVLFAFATIVCLLALAATYYFFVRTTTGQFIDESALVQADTIRGPAGRASTKFLDWLPLLSLVIAAVVVLFVTIVRRRWTAAGIAVAACVVANLATQLLKDWFPDRPYRGVQTLELNSLPSGHTTLAASAAAAVFLMVSPRWRPLAGFLGATFAVASGVSTLINQWHRPADVIAAFLVVATVMLPAGWLVLRTGKAWNAWGGHDGHWASSRLWTLLPGAAVVASAAIAAYALREPILGMELTDSTSSYFWAGTAMIVGTGYLAMVAAVWFFAWAAPHPSK